MTIFIREFKRNSRGLIIWSSILLLYSIMMFALYPELYQQSEMYASMIDKMPKGLMAAFGADSLDFTNILSYFGTYIHLYFTLTGAIYAMILGAGILSKEESEKTVEFLLSKPITRNEVITGKLVCIITNVLLFNLIFSLSTFIFAEVYKKQFYDRNHLLLMLLGTLFIMLMFASMGLFLSVFIVKAKAIYPLSIGTVMGIFIIGIMSDITKNAEFFKYFSPFKYISHTDIIKKGRIETSYLIIFALLSVLPVLLTYLIYNKKNITL